jgi:hypothetical protein
MIVGSASASTAIGTWWTPGVLAPRLEVLGRISRRWMLGGVTDYAFLTSDGTIPFSPFDFAISGRSHFFHGMIETRFVTRSLREWTRGQGWFAILSGVGGAYTTDEQDCSSCNSNTRSVVAGPALGFQGGADVRIEGPFWFEFAGHVTFEDFVGSEAHATQLAGPWFEWGVSVGLRFDVPPIDQ